jgi:hypothetical protein
MWILLGSWDASCWGCGLPLRGINKGYVTGNTQRVILKGVILKRGIKELRIKSTE